MILLKKLKERGWYLTEEGLNKLSVSDNLQTEDVNKITSLALDWDFKDIAAGALPAKPDSNGFIPGRIVLQIQKIRNLSAPKANEESTAAPRFLQLELSDGVNTIVGLEFERIASLNLNIPPGTKLFMKAEQFQLMHGFLILKALDVQVLGGKVELLVEKWEVARMLKYAKNVRRPSGSSGPPPWIAFGKPLDAHKDALSTDKNFKSLQAATEKEKNSKENNGFNVSRSKAIAEATKAGQKKVFGGGQQNILDHNVKKILEKGYSEDEAKQALKATSNNLERALYNLKRRNNNRGGSAEKCNKPATVLAGGRVRDRGGANLTKEEAAAAKPHSNVSLFDFLTDKMIVSGPPAVSVQSQAGTNNVSSGRNSKESLSKLPNNSSKPLSAAGNRFENNMSSSFAANRATTKSDDKLYTQLCSNNFNQKQEERKSQTVNKIAKGGDRNNGNKTQSLNLNHDQAPAQTSTIHENNKNSTNNNNIKRSERSLKKEREQTPKQQINEYPINKRNTFKTTESKSYQQRENIRNNVDIKGSNQFHQKQTHKTDSFAKDLDSLVDSTSKISIQTTKDSSYDNQHNRVRNQQKSRSDNLQTPTMSQLHTKQSSDNYSNNTQQPVQLVGSHTFSSKVLQQNQQPAPYVTQIGNGFAYDPSKIMGFQSKEANEYAMNLLKSQGLTMQQLHHQQAIPPQAQQATSLPPPTPSQHHVQAQILNSQAPPAVAFMAQNHNLFVPPPQHAPPQFGVMPGGNWPWKIGDLCLAKYWDDGNFYDAKITAVSDKTCVVLFLGYGNHEEVLKSDCLPITDSQHIPLNAYQNNMTAPPMSQPPVTPFQQRSTMQTEVLSAGGNQRYRVERQMYVPPPKRSNN